jgi:hypothetical protein
MPGTGSISSTSSNNSIGSAITSIGETLSVSSSTRSTRAVAGSMKFMSGLYLLIGGLIAFLTVTSVSKEIKENKLFIASFVLFMFIGLVGLITIFSTRSGMSSSNVVANHRGVLSLTGYLLIIAFGLFLGAFATTPNPEFEDKEEEETTSE